MAPLLPLRSLMHAPSSGRRPLLSIPEAAITGDPLQIRLGRDCEFPGYNAFRRFRVEVAMERVELLHLIADLVEAIFYADNPEWRFNIIKHHKEQGMFGAKNTSLYRKCVDEQLAKDLQLVDSTAETAPNFPFLLFL
ncbi:uncharacterized protein LOC104582798 isoform X1 [Brachypodium distachyon]|uniref:Uncharacterized protein n=1 Tax=Brachypodium distachyon TaxID=15368 RepID=A0A0Q3GD64_BRADI|nr:uncharacterized protein LOC104582798 isoform X1 [Brachypodium distachyon]KQK08437.1 hypothetical protein BRADI_2g41856v3 [Brachypodium distachyon]|eukprot:XP_010231948.1 uncharacterized protein LOC104582798 isoform X1 [Brachypodium distachyon]